MNQDIQYLLLVVVNFHKLFTDFRVQVLDDNAFRVGIPADSWPRLLKLAKNIQYIGCHNFLTKNVLPDGRRIPYGPKLGEFTISLCCDNTRNAHWLYHSPIYGFKSPDCNRLKASRLYCILSDYIIHADVSTRGTIFG